MLNHHFTDHATLIQLKADTLLATGQTAAEALHQLIVDIRETLPDSKKHYLKYRSPEQIEAHFAKDYPVFAALSQDGELVACAMMSDLSDPEMADFNAAHYGSENLCTGNWALHTVGVLPSQRGQKLMKSLLSVIKSAVSEAPDKFQALFSKVADSNTHSQANFQAAGFATVGGGFDPKGYTYTRFGLNIVAPQLAPDQEIDFNIAYVPDHTRPTAFGS